MRTQVTYCSARGRDVLIAFTDEPMHDGQAPLHDEELVCLDIGGQCTLDKCPVCGLPSQVLAARLVHNGLQSALNPVVKRPCPVCDHVTEYVIIDGHYATCVECGRTVDYPALRSPA